MNSRPLVSTVVAFLNGERFIEETIESVFAQTYNNWELLLVDDGSTDGSSQIALRYAEQHPGKVLYLEHPGHRNRGKEASRNLGLRHAKGEYIAFLDHDDVWLSHALERQVAIFDSYPEAGMIYGPTQVWYSWTGNTEDSQRDFRTLVGEKGDAKLNMLLKAPTGLLNNLLQPSLTPPNGLVPTPCSVLLRREMVKSVGGFEEEFQGISAPLDPYEDQALWIKVGLQAPVFVANECWSRYRQHPDSSWASYLKSDQKYSKRFFFLHWIAEYLSEQGVEDTEVWGLLREEQLVVKVRLYRQKREWKRVVWGLLVLVRRYPRGFFVRAWRKVRRLLASSAAR